MPNSLTETLGRQVGPLPVGAWAVVVIGGLGIGWYARSRGGSDTVPEEDLASIPSGGSGGAIDLGGSSPPVADPIASRAPVDNDEWARIVQRDLVADGRPVLVVDSMLRKFLAGEPLNEQEQQLYALAILRNGPPPLLPPPVEGPPSTANPPPTTNPPPTQVPFPLIPPPMVKATHIGGGSYRVVWTKVPGATGYQVRAVTGHTGDTVRTVGANVSQYTTVRGIMPKGGHLAFEVRTVKGSAHSDWKRWTVYGRN